MASCIRLSVYQKPSFRPPHLWHNHHESVSCHAICRCCELATDDGVTKDDEGCSPLYLAPQQQVPRPRHRGRGVPVKSISTKKKQTLAPLLGTFESNTELSSCVPHRCTMVKSNTPRPPDAPVTATRCAHRVSLSCAHRPDPLHVSQRQSLFATIVLQVNHAD